MTLMHVMIVDPKQSNVLVNAEGRLPVVDFDGSYCSDVEEMCKVVEALIHRQHRLIFLRPEAEIIYPEKRGSMFASLLIFESQHSDNSGVIPTFHWIAQSDADTIGVCPTNETIIQYLQEYKRNGLEVHGSRLWPYSRPGWYTGACSWMRNEIRRTTGHHMTEAAMVTVHDGGCVIRARTEAGGTFYLKGVIPDKHAEVRVSRALGKILSEAFPAPLAVDEKRGLMLMNNYGKTMCAEECSSKSNPEEFRRVLLNWSHVQKLSVSVVDELIKDGVPVHDVRYFRNKVNEVASDPAWFEGQIGVIREKGRKEYSHEEYKRKYTEHAEDVLAKIEEMDWPMSIIHGDLNPVNITKDIAGNLIYFDYEYTAIGYGFLDARDFGFACNRVSNFEDIDFYMNEWKTHLRGKTLSDYYPWMKALNDLRSVCDAYDQWMRSEECGRKFHTRELSNTFLVCRHFE